MHALSWRRVDNLRGCTCPARACLLRARGLPPIWVLHTARTNVPATRFCLGHNHTPLVDEAQSALLVAPCGRWRSQVTRIFRGRSTTPARRRDASPVDCHGTAAKQWPGAASGSSARGFTSSRPVGAERAATARRAVDTPTNTTLLDLHGLEASAAPRPPLRPKCTCCAGCAPQVANPTSRPIAVAPVSRLVGAVIIEEDAITARSSGAEPDRAAA